MQSDAFQRDPTKAYFNELDDKAREDVHHRGNVTKSGTAPGALDRKLQRKTDEPKKEIKLEDFELIRVLGKGCAGRVSRKVSKSPKARC